jgi:lipoprotein-releasing system ATP-binding protein|tara:strand:- start:230 stop:904 length:675 start_codon:yes stop_codon:yes gene_type:complete
MPDFVANAVTKEFDTPAGPLRILDGISTKLDRGQNMAVIGDSGSGKSTFLHIAGTLDSPTSGNVCLMGSDLTELNENQLAHFRNENIGFIFQEHHLLPQLTVLENVLLPMVATGATDSDSIQRAKDLLDSVGLSDRLNHRPTALSGGERQRVAVARALIKEPILLLADEPTGSLDQVNAEKTGQLLLDLQRQHNMILICVTHSSKLASVFQNKTRLVDGRLAPV